MASDNFNSGAGALSANWTTWQDAADAKLEQSAGGKCVQHNPGAGVANGRAAYTGASFASDQSSEVVITEASNYQYLYVRIGSPGASFNGYECVFSTGLGTIIRIVTAGGYAGNVATSGTSPAAGNTVKFSVTGSTLSASINGAAAYISGTDSTYSGTGLVPGIGQYDAGTAHTMDNWTGTGDGGGGGGGTPASYPGADGCGVFYHSDSRLSLPDQSSHEPLLRAA